jgi:predicted unusual protein kinase regulating ubiquinone biosynthesis (AarF/ABC1/UbiB family)
MEWKIEQNKLIKFDNDDDSDLRLEAAAIEYEREKNAFEGKEDNLPQVDWPATGKNILVLYYEEEK